MTTLTASEAATAGLAIGAYLGVVYALIIVISILIIIALWNIFKKAGEPGWKALIPIYNVYILYKISWSRKAFWITLLILLALSITLSFFRPYTNAYNIVNLIYLLALLVADITISCKLSSAFGHGAGYSLGLIFLPNIFTMILGFGKSKYVGPEKN